MKRFLQLFMLLFFTNTVSANKLVVVTEHMPPLQVVRDGMVVGGLSGEIVSLLLNKVGDTAEVRPTNWARAYNTALAQENVMIFSISRNKKREKLFKWAGSLITLDHYLWRLKARADVNPTSLELAKKHNVAVIRDDVHHHLLLEKGFAQSDLKVVAHYEQAIDMLYRQRVELFAGSELFIKYRLKAINRDFSDLQPVVKLDSSISTLYVAFSNKTADAVVEKYRRALSEIKQNGSYDAILKKWKLQNNRSD